MNQVGSPETTRQSAGDDFVSDAGMAIRNRSVRGEGLLLWIVAAVIGLFVVWAYFAVLDEVVRGTGKVIPSSQVQVIQNLEGGIVEEIHVREGEVIDAGQVLVTIDDTRFDAGLQQLNMAGSGDSLRNLLGRDDPRNIRFDIDTFHANFHELFVSYRDRGVPLHRNFLPLGICLMCLYATLDSLDVPLDVRAVVEQAQ